MIATSRIEANKFGTSRYFTGLPCPRGHIAERYRRGACVLCQKEDKARRYKESPSMREYNNAWRKRNLDKVRQWSREAFHKKKGMPAPTRPRPELCENCGEKEQQKRVLALDHCYATGKFRGWLCFDCNTGIGKLGDTADSLRRALSYIERSENV